MASGFLIETEWSSSVKIECGRDRHLRGQERVGLCECLQSKVTLCDRARAKNRRIVLAGGSKREPDLLKGRVKTNIAFEEEEATLVE
jgi:hypothetical protein